VQPFLLLLGRAVLGEQLDVAGFGGMAVESLGSGQRAVRLYASWQQPT
jgi:hypothetical protein